MRAPDLTPTLQQHLLDKLRLSIGEAARMTGVSVRQLSYWTQKGLVRALGTPGKKRYDFRALERVALIKRHLNEGYSLDQAAREAERWQRARHSPEVIAQSLAELEEVVLYLRQRLAQATTKAQLASTARQLSLLDVASLLAEHATPMR